MKIYNFFDKIVYINLDHRVDRNYQFKEEMSKHSIPIPERISGILANRNEGVDYGRAGHIACGKVHSNIVKYAKEHNFDNILIFEDDASFYDKGELQGIDIIEKALDKLSNLNDWDLLYLSGLIIDENLTKVADNLLECKTVLTTHAYAINKKAYDKILKYNPETDSAIDGWYGQQANESNEIGSLFKKYVVYPLAMVQRESPSDCDIRYGIPSLGHGLDPYYNCYSKPIIEKYDI